MGVRERRTKAKALGSIFCPMSQPSAYCTSGRAGIQPNSLNCPSPANHNGSGWIDDRSVSKSPGCIFSTVSSPPRFFSRIYHRSFYKVVTDQGHLVLLPTVLILSRENVSAANFQLPL